MRKFGWKGKQALNPPARQPIDCECYHERFDITKLELGSNPDCPVHFPQSYDRDGVELGRNCVTLDYCTKQNLCYGHCKLY